MPFYVSRVLVRLSFWILGLIKWSLRVNYRTFGHFDQCFSPPLFLERAFFLAVACVGQAPGQYAHLPASERNAYL